MDNIDIPSERALLASLLQHGNDAYVDVQDILTDGTLTQECNICGYKVVEYLNKTYPDIKKIDLPLFISGATATGLDKFFNQPEEKKYIKSLYNFDSQKENAIKFAAKLAKLEIARIYRENCIKTDQNLSKITGDEKLGDILSIIENPLFDLSQRIKGFDKLNKSPEQIFKLRLRQYIEDKRNNPVQQIGFPTGFQIWDRLIGGGLRSPSVNVVVARQKMGKSSFLATVACNLAKLGIPVLMLDTEMGEDESFSRMTAAISKVPITEIETGQFTRNPDKDRRVGEAVSLLESLPYYYINIAGQPFEETLTEIRRWLTKKVGLDEKGHAKECVIILDYLKIMSKDSIRNMAEHQEFGFMTTSLVNSTIRYKFPCLTSGQTNRDGINTEDMSVVAGSDRIGWFATNVSLFKPHSAEELLAQRQAGIRIPFNRKLINLVARHGPGNDEGDWINLRFNRDICHIEEGPLQSILTAELEENQGGFSQDGEQQEF